jgi:hypothetical protein
MVRIHAGQPRILHVLIGSPIPAQNSGSSDDKPVKVPEEQSVFARPTASPSPNPSIESAAALRASGAWAASPHVFGRQESRQQARARLTAEINQPPSTPRKPAMLSLLWNACKRSISPLAGAPLYWQPCPSLPRPSAKLNGRALSVPVDGFLNAVATVKRESPSLRDRIL